MVCTSTIVRSSKHVELTVPRYISVHTHIQIYGTARMYKKMVTTEGNTLGYVK
jgi:hypothetical protein